MKKIDLGQTLGILANVGVIAGIVFLGIELRDNTTQAQVATTQESISQRTGWWELVGADAALAGIYVRGLADFQQLSPVEQAQFDLLMRSYMSQISASMSARARGLIGLDPGSELDERVLEGDLFRMLEEPGFREWWANADRRGIPSRVTDVADELDAIRAERE